MGLLDDDVTLITGGGSGLGRAVVRRFVEEGSHVAVLERSEEKAADLVEEFGDQVEVVVGDVTSIADNERGVARTLDRFGRLDTFIGNVGVWDFNVRFEDMKPEDLSSGFDQLFSVNVKGLMLGARAALGPLKESSGNIIFTLSNAASIPGGGGVLYTTSKHAGVGLVRQLAWELQDQVRVNAVAPGGMSTELTGVPALGHDQLRISDQLEAAGGPDELAQRMGKKFFPTAEDYVLGYVMLASRQCRTTTGSVVEMHGVLPPPHPQQ